MLSLKHISLISFALACFASAPALPLQARRDAKVPPDFHPGMSAGDRQFLWGSGRAVYPDRRQALPASQINSTYLPSIVSQREAPVCYYMAMGYYIRTYQEAREHGWVRPDPETDPDKVIDGFFLAHFDYLIPFIRTFGAPTYAASDYDEAAQFPTPECFAEAQLHRIDRVWYPEFAGTADVMPFVRQQIADGDVLYAEIEARQNFDNYDGETGDGFDNGVFYEYAGVSNRGPHAITIVGYDDDRPYNDSGTAKTGAVLAVNSWGSWGWTLPGFDDTSGGFIWIGYDFFIDFVSDSLLVVEDRPSDPCLDYAVIDYTHENADELIMSVEIGDTDIGPDEEYGLSLDQAFGRRPVNGIVRVPIDRLTARGAETFRLTGVDLNLPLIYGPGVRLGTIRSFSIERAGIGTWTSEDTPIFTTDWNALNPADMPEHIYALEIGLFGERETTKLDIHPAVLGTGDCVTDVGDFDRDGDLDIIAQYPNSGSTYAFGIFRNRGDGRMEWYESNLPTGHVTLADVADFNNDGFLDVLLGIDDAFGIFYREPAFAEFSDSGLRFPVEDDHLVARAVDWNHDGNIDVAVSARIEYAVPLPDNTPWSFWWNNGDGTFTESSWQIGGDYNQRPFMEFADMDRDGWEDMVIAVSTPGRVDYGIYVYSFVDENTFPNNIATISGLHNDIAGVQVADTNGDGWLDVIIKTYTGTHRIFLNDPGLNFSETTSNLQDLKTLAFGDVDNDGVPDVAATGKFQDADHVGLYRNTGTQDYSYLTGLDIVPYVTGENDDLESPDVELADFDSDGDLDFVAFGKYARSGAQWDEAYIGLHYFENHTAEPLRFNRPNTPPTRPELAVRSFNSATGELTIEWPQPSDDISNVEELAYRYSVGTLPDWANLSTDAFTRSQPLEMHPLPNGGICTATIQVPTSRASFVRVQALDDGLAASEWSAPLSVYPPNAAYPYDVNRDQFVDSADGVSMALLSTSGNPDDIARADLNADGVVDGGDRLLLNREITGATAPDPNLLGTLDVTPDDGGLLVTEQFSISVPSHTFDVPVSVDVYPGQEDPAVTGLVPGSVVELSGIPDSRNGSYQIMLPVGANNPDETVLVYGRETLPTSIWEPTLSWRMIRPTSIDGGMFVFDIPPFQPLADRSHRRNSIEVVDAWFGLADEVYQIEREHFIVQFDSSIPTASVLEMITAMEWTWNELTTTYGLKSSGISGKVQVQFRDIDEAGFYCPILDYIAINQTNVNSLTPPNQYNQTTLTGVHELTHRFTRQYYRATAGLLDYRYDTEWPDEAAAVWMECQYNSDSADGARTVMDESMMVPFEIGLNAGLDGKEAYFGYGMAPLMKYFVGTRGKTDFPEKLWRFISLDYKTLDAINAAAAQQAEIWWHDYVGGLLLGNLYPIRPQVLTNGLKKREFNTVNMGPSEITEGPAVRFEVPEVKYLTSPLFSTLINDLFLDTDMTISHCLTARIGYDVECSTFAYHPSINSGDPDVEHISDLVAMNGAYKLDVPVRAEWLANSDWRVMNVASMLTDPQGASNPMFMHIGITQDRKWDGPSGLTVENGGTYQIGLSEGLAPSYNVTYSVDGPGLARIRTLDYGTIGKDFLAWLLGQTPAEFDIEFQATPVNLSRIESTDTGYKVHTAGAIKTYRYRISSTQVDGSNTDIVEERSDGRLNYIVEPNDEIVSMSVEVVYDITEQIYDDNDNLLDTIVHTDVWTRLSGVTLFAYPFVLED
ncbi:VCBS repeat-containing protein [bacterium]|nr:VCBS repeat-containing protein [bacterium]